MSAENPDYKETYLTTVDKLNSESNSDSIPESSLSESVSYSATYIPGWAGILLGLYCGL